jgi:hypothetical protein
LEKREDTVIDWHVTSFGKETNARFVIKDGDCARKKGYIALEIFSAAIFPCLECFAAAADIALHNLNFEKTGSRDLRPNHRRTTSSGPEGFLGKRKEDTVINSNPVHFGKTTNACLVLRDGEGGRM